MDDEVSLLVWLSRWLESLGWTVVTATDRAGAQRVLADRHVDAIILDLNLRGESGLDVLEHVRYRRHLAHLPVLMFTGISWMNEWQEETIRRNGAYVFYKPGSPAEIDATLRRLLG